MSDTKHYYKKTAVNKNIRVEFNSELDAITVAIERKLKSGDSLGTDYIRLHPSYIEPLYKLLKEVTKEPLQ